MEVEIYIGFVYSGGSGGSWSTDYVTIPDNWHEEWDSIESFISNWMAEEDQKGRFEKQVAFWGIYNIPPLEEETD